MKKPTLLFVGGNVAVYFIDWLTLEIKSKDDLNVSVLSKSTRMEVDLNDIPTPYGDSLNNYEFNAEVEVNRNGEWGDPRWMFASSNNKSFGTAVEMYQNEEGLSYLVLTSGNYVISGHAVNTGAPYTTNGNLSAGKCRIKITILGRKK